MSRAYTPNESNIIRLSRFIQFFTISFIYCVAIMCQWVPKMIKCANVAVFKKVLVLNGHSENGYRI